MYYQNTIGVFHWKGKRYSDVLSGVCKKNLPGAEDMVSWLDLKNTQSKSNEYKDQRSYWIESRLTGSSGNFPMKKLIRIWWCKIDGYWLSVRRQDLPGTGDLARWVGHLYTRSTMRVQQHCAFPAATLHCHHIRFCITCSHQFPPGSTLNLLQISPLEIQSKSVLSAS